MNCGMECIKYILFVFNFVFALAGLGILIMAVLIHQGVASNIQDAVEVNVSLPALTLLVIGAVIFIIAFFGCCGAIRESHCMVITFAVFIMTLLVIQIAVAIYIFSVVGPDGFRTGVDKIMDKSMSSYYEKAESRELMNSFQTMGQCCGYNSWRDYTNNSRNQSIPYSCCGALEGKVCDDQSKIYQTGCKDAVPAKLRTYGKVMGSVALGVAAVELVGIVFALCLASSIKNAERRGYKV